MDTRDTGGPAFPSLYVYTDRDGEVSSTSESGMSLRDFFAAKAMAALICEPIPAAGVTTLRALVGDCNASGPELADHFAKAAGMLADAMLKERA